MAATDFETAVSQAITSSNQLHDVINGTAIETVDTDSGEIPSVRKALADSMMFIAPIPWEDGVDETNLFQTRSFESGTYWAPSATIVNPVPMGGTPIGDNNWFLAPVSLTDEHIIATTAPVFSNANLLSNHNFLVPSPDDITHPSATPTDYTAGTQIFSGVFVESDVVGFTYINGRVKWTNPTGAIYLSVPNTNGLEYVTEFTASVADFDGKPRTRGVAFALVGDEYRVTVGIDALSDGVDDTLLGSVKFEQGKVATGHELQSTKGQLYTFDKVSTMISNAPPAGSRASTSGYYYSNDGGADDYVISTSGSGNGVDSILLSNGTYANRISYNSYDPLLIPSQTDIPLFTSGSVGCIPSGVNLVDKLNIYDLHVTQDSHYGLTSFAVESADSNFNVISRRAGSHNQTTDGQIRQWRNNFGSRDVRGDGSVIYASTGNDVRDFTIGYMNNARVGIVSPNAGNSGGSFIYSDDGMSTWTVNENTTLPRGFSPFFGILNVPSSVGGNDDTFIAYGNNYAGGNSNIGLVKTTNNGATWTFTDIPSLVAPFSPDTVSEPSVCRIGNNDFWVMSYRVNDTNNEGKLIISTSTDMESWSTPIEVDFELGPSPTQALYDNGYLYVFTSQRKRSRLPNYFGDKDFGGKVTYARIPAWNALTGDFSGLAKQESIMSLDNMLGYLFLIRSPFTGAWNGTVAYRELDTTIDGEPNSTWGGGIFTKLALVTTDITPYPSQMTKLFNVNSLTPDEVNWDVRYDEMNGWVDMYAYSVRIPGGVAGNPEDLSRDVKFPNGLSMSSSSNYFVSTGISNSNVAVGSTIDIVRSDAKSTTQFTCLYRTDTAQGAPNWVEVDIHISGRGFWARGL